jgi:hypothetical protein
MTDAFATLFSRNLRRRTLLNSVYVLISIIGLWAGSIYVPAAVTQISVRQGYAAPDAARMASYGAAVLAIAAVATPTRRFITG